MKKQILGLLAVASLFTVGCAHHRDVRPGAEGIHRVVLSSDNDDDAERDAISQAETFCEKRGKSPAFVNEEKKYTGSMDEKS
jgi:hypothetical protein